MFQYSNSLRIGLISLACVLSGCTSVEGDFPSLSKRPYETDMPIEAPNATAAPVTTVLPIDLKSLTNAMVAKSATAQEAFDKALPSARLAASSAAGSSRGGESWVQAHMILSRADSARADGVAALGEIDNLISRERDKGADTGLLALLAVPQRLIADQVNTQNAEIERLTKLIGL